MSSREKKTILLASLVLAIISLAVYTVKLPTRAVASGESSKEIERRVINISGQGTVKASPDIAYITLGVINEDANAKVAQKKNAEEMSKLMSAIKNSGIKDEDIKTISYNIYPKYDYDKNTGISKIIGYSVNNTVQVTVRDILKTGTIIDIAAENGANTSGGISFSLSNYEEYYNDALKAAVENAKNKAGSIADVLGVSLKLPISITENSGYQQPIYYKSMDNALAAEMASTPIESGIIEIKASVSVVYEY
jgi:uncharacterized protein YggE